MKERPIIFSAPMVQAILDGRKTQTRRIGKTQCAEWTELAVEYSRHAKKGTVAVATHLAYPRGTARHGICECPYGIPGDRLWVREAWGLHAYGDDTDWLKGGCTAMDLDDHVIAYRADWGPLQDGCHWRPSIHMPRAASRITLEITSVRVERLQDISEVDALAEGVTDDGSLVTDLNGKDRGGTIAAYATLWEVINGVGSWDDNPWVWVVSFKRAFP